MQTTRRNDKKNCITYAITYFNGISQGINDIEIELYIASLAHLSYIYKYFISYAAQWTNLIL